MPNKPLHRQFLVKSIRATHDDARYTFVVRAHPEPNSGGVGLQDPGPAASVSPKKEVAAPAEDALYYDSSVSFYFAVVDDEMIESLRRQMAGSGPDGDVFMAVDRDKAATLKPDRLYLLDRAGDTLDITTDDWLRDNVATTPGVRLDCADSESAAEPEELAELSAGPGESSADEETPEPEQKESPQPPHRGKNRR